MIKKCGFLAVSILLLFFSCNPDTDIGDGAGSDLSDTTSSTEAFKIQTASDAFLTLAIDDIGADGKSLEGTLYTWDGSSNFNDVSFLNESGSVITSGRKVLSLTQIAPDYVIIVLPGESSTTIKVYLCRLSTADMFFLNPVLSDDSDILDPMSYSLAMDIAYRDSVIRTSFIMDADLNLYTDFYTGTGTNQQVVKITIDGGTERVSREILTAASFSVDQFAVNSGGDIIFGYNSNQQFAYRTSEGATGLFTPPENHEFVRVFTGSDNQAWIVSDEISGLGPNLFQVDFSNAAPSMVETAGISVSAKFDSPAFYDRDSSETTFYSVSGITTISSAGTVNTVIAGVGYGSGQQIYKDKRYLFGSEDQDESTGLVFIADLQDDTISRISLTGDNYDILQMNDMAAVPGSIFLSLEQTLSGNIFLYEVQGSGIVNSLSSLTQKQRIISKITLP